MTTTSTEVKPDFYRCDECDLLVAQELTVVVVKKLLPVAGGQSIFIGEPKALCNFCKERARERSR